MPRVPFRSRYLPAAVAVLMLTGGTVALGSGAAVAAADAAPGQLSIVSLSNRPDLLTAGDALLEVKLPAGVKPEEVRVDLAGRDVTASFARRPDGRFYGRVEGLELGTTVVAARAGGRGARLPLTNHPRGGPVFSGPQIQPWVCTTQAAGLGEPQDAQCNGNTTYTFTYKDTVTGRFTSYDPDDPPPAARVATTTTDTGVTVPYIVRDERGTLDRGIYDIAVLFDPSKPFEPWAPQPGWNGKLGFKFGAACNPGHTQGAAVSPLDDMMLSRGFAVAVSSANVFGNVCNHVVAAESVMMVKERLVERYGEIRYTIGSGCSGGSEAQNTIAENYPGLLDGILPTCTFADAWTPALLDKFDCPLFNRYFNTVSPHLWAVEQQRAAVLGGAASSAICAEAGYAFAAATWDPSTGCGLDAEAVYERETNPGGVRCTLQDYNANALGHRPDGFGNGVNDHVGLEWGRKALDDGVILAEQFVDLNEKIGGFDIDFEHQAERTAGDVAGITHMYRTGQLTYGENLAKVPSIDARSDDTYDFHSNVHRDILRARMVRSVGNHDSQAYWTETNAGAFGAPVFTATRSFEAMDRWLAAIEADTSADPLEVKVVRNKPADVSDQCFTAGEPVDSGAACETAYTDNILPRQVAGMPLSGDVLKCQLEPLRRDDYSVTFTDEQWSRLQAAFPAGVCDFSKPSVGFRKPVAGAAWLSLASGPGGTPLPAAPVSTAFGGKSGAAGGTAGSPTAQRLPATGLLTAVPLLAVAMLLGAGAARRRGR
ncbi:MAG: DUF6351 family protein [Mycobacteriales bacterium]